jgi:hypothetical protein
MSPNTPPFYHADKAARHSIFGSDNVLESPITANGENLLLSQFCVTVGCSNGLPAKADVISYILSARSPIKVGGGVIRLVPIAVANLLAVFRFTDKNLRHKAMNIAIRLLAVARQLHGRVTSWSNVGSKVLRRQCAATLRTISHSPPQRADFPQVGHFIPALETGHCSPIFHNEETNI